MRDYDALSGLERDKAEMLRASGFCAQVLRSEMGPGGLCDDVERVGWEAAVKYLETLGVAAPMIPLYQWRHYGEVR